MATLTRNTTLAADETVTNTILHNLIDTATVSAIARGDMAAGSTIITVSTTAPTSPATGELWFDSNPGSNQGVIKQYDGAIWRQVGEGFLAYFGLASGTVEAGAIVRLDLVTSQPSDGRLCIQECTATTDKAIGIALTQMTTSATTGVVVTRGKVTNVKKLTGTAWTAGDAIVPTATTGEATTNTTAAWGALGGSGSVGIVLADAASGNTTGYVLVTGTPQASHIGCAEDAPALIADEVTPSTDVTWSGSWGTPTYYDLSAAPKNTIGRILRIRIRSAAAGTADRAVFLAVRHKGSTATGYLAPCISGTFTEGGATDSSGNGLMGDVFLPGAPGASDDQIEIYVDREASTLADLRVSIWEVAVVAGGVIV